MMRHQDPVPETHNRLATALGYLLHPYVIAVVTLWLLLNPLPLRTALGWLVLVAGLVLGPGIVLILALQRRGQQMYQRVARGPVYLLVWVSILLCLVVLLVLDAPQVLTASVAALAVWVPLQLVINTVWTKISTHTAVVAGCVAALWWLGKLDSPLLQAGAVAIVALTMWSRYVTRHHILIQVVLGVVVGAGAVLLVFPLLLSRSS